MGLREDKLGLHNVIQKLFLMFVENFQVNRTNGLPVSFCGQGMDKGMALTQWCLGDVLREFVSRGSVAVNIFHFLTPYPDVCLQDLDLSLIHI